MRRFRQILTILCWLSSLFLWSGFSSNKAIAQDLGNLEILEQAHARLDQKDTLGSIHEMERYIFWSNSDREAQVMYKDIADLYKQRGDFAAAERYYSQAVSYLGYDWNYYESFFQKGLMAFLQGKYPEAEYAWGFSYRQNSFDSIQKRSETMLLLAMNMNHKWKEANSLANSLFSENEVFINELNQVYETFKRFKPKKVRTARTLSVFLPGLGQMYAGKPGKGLLSLALSAASLGLAVYAGIEGHYIFAVLMGTSVPTRFWVGGMDYAAELAEQFNERKQLEMAKEVNLMILSQIGMESIKEKR